MIDRIVGEIRAAMSHELYLSALALALTLPDTCGKAEYPEAGVGARYQNWFNTYVMTDRCDSPYGADMPYLSAEIVYSLRNSLLHQSTPNVNSSNIREERCQVDKFELVLSNDTIADGDLSRVTYGKGMRIDNRELQVHVSHLCYILCAAAESYYKDNKSKFSFIQYSLTEKRKKHKVLPLTEWPCG